MAAAKPTQGFLHTSHDGTQQVARSHNSIRAGDSLSISSGQHKLTADGGVSSSLNRKLATCQAPALAA
jgi:hypothetical protein